MPLTWTDAIAGALVGIAINAIILYYLSRRNVRQYYLAERKNRQGYISPY
jgi:uncharacterized membrane-anchored protein YhcB (DUF1043 family)